MDAGVVQTWLRTGRVAFADEWPDKFNLKLRSIDHFGLMLSDTKCREKDARRCVVSRQSASSVPGNIDNIASWQQAERPCLCFPFRRMITVMAKSFDSDSVRDELHI